MFQMQANEPFSEDGRNVVPRFVSSVFCAPVFDANEGNRETPHWIWSLYWACRVLKFFCREYSFISQIKKTRRCQSSLSFVCFCWSSWITLVVEHCHIHCLHATAHKSMTRWDGAIRNKSFNKITWFHTFHPNSWIFLVVSNDKPHTHDALGKKHYVAEDSTSQKEEFTSFQFRLIYIPDVPYCMEYTYIYHLPSIYDIGTINIPYTWSIVWYESSVFFDTPMFNTCCKITLVYH